MKRAVALLLTVSASLVSAQTLRDGLEEAVIDREIEAALKNRVNDVQNTVGIIVGILTPEGTRYFPRGVTEIRRGN